MYLLKPTNLSGTEKSSVTTIPIPGMPGGLGPGGELIPGIIGLLPPATPNCWFILAAAAAAACWASIDLKSLKILLTLYSRDQLFKTNNVVS